MDKQTMQDIAELKNQVQALNQALNTQGAELAALRAALECKQDKVFIKKDGLSAEQLGVIHQEMLERTRLCNALVSELHVEDSPTADLVREVLLQELRPGGLLHQGGSHR
ncbi:hypothetical protein [Vreelandella sp.]|uniref:hypothetical protein n=1 Tax=Vreelandella sp. TaxID=3137778 RepID=UPI003BA9175C